MIPKGPFRLVTMFFENAASQQTTIGRNYFNFSQRNQPSQIFVGLFSISQNLDPNLAKNV